MKCSLVCSLPSPAAIAGTWSDDFEGDNLDKWKTTGSLPPPPALLPKDACKIENGKLIVDASRCIIMMIAEMPEWSDYAVECKMEWIGGLIKDSELKLMFRYIQESLMEKGYGYWERLRGMLGFWMYDGAQVTNIPPTFGLRLPSVGVWRIEAEGEHLRFFENDSLILSITDKAYNKGKAGILVANTSITVDYFLVRTLPSSPVEPQTKLAITWGRLKTL